MFANLEVFVLHVFDWHEYLFFIPRLNSFSKAGKLIQEAEAKAEAVMPLLLNATYTAMNTSDLALRYSAMGLVGTVIDVLGKMEDGRTGDWFDVLVMGCLLPAVKEAVKSKQEVYFYLATTLAAQRCEHDRKAFWLFTTKQARH